METSIDGKFMENTEAIVAQFGFKDLKSFIKNQALLMMMARIEKFETENRRFEAKYHQSFHEVKEKMGKSLNQEVFEKEEDYLDWRFAKEAMDRLKKQKLELEHA